MGQFNPEPNHGGTIKLRWKLKQSNTNQIRTIGFEKTFLLDPKPGSLSAAKTIHRMMPLRSEIDMDQKYAALFLDAQKVN